ncbi:MAG TPA: TetR/AcrR family transcriptional regulator, partial [Actinobacteria bacterium]|nr:TetR/AcrR family transcriptional regulator [Actinomycetota bacterium]
AAKTLLSTQGYEATSPRDVQASSGVGQGSFYHHFAGKADLAFAALLSLADEMSDAFDSLADGDGIDLIGGYLNVPRDALSGCRIGRIAMESSMADDRIRVPIAGYFSHMRLRLTGAFSLLDTGMAPEALADLAIATVQGGYVLARVTADPQALRNATSALDSLIRSFGATGDDR